MPYHPAATDAPFDLGSGRVRFLYHRGHQVPIVARSRRRVIVDAYGRRYSLCRRWLERDGIASAGGQVFTVTTYALPDAAADAA